MFLSRLIFYSTNKVQALEGSLQQELKSILIASQQHNNELNVTGALVFDYSHFAQILEGDRAAISKIFCKISQDPRHSDIVLMDVSPINKRQFTNWTMGFVGGAGSDVYLKEFSTENEFHPEKMSTESLIEFIHTIIGLSNQNNQPAKMPKAS